MSSGPQQFTVRVNSDVISQEQINQYRTLMMEWGLPMAPDRRIPLPDGHIELRTDPNRICIWDNQADAQRFADELASRTNAEWLVEECDGEE